MNEKYIGFVQAILYVLLITISNLFLNVIGKKYNISFILFGISFISIIYLSYLVRSRLLVIFNLIKHNKLLWLLMSGGLAVLWWLGYYTTVYASPRLSLITYYIIVSLFSCCVKRYYFQGLAMSILLVYVYFILPEVTLITIMTSSVAGIGAYINLKSGQILSTKCKMTVTEILAIRFYLLFITSFISCFYYSDQIVTTSYSILELLFVILIMAIFNMILPNYAAQSSINYIGTERFNFITSITPLVIFIMQGVYYNDWSYPILLLCIGIILCSNLHKFIHILIRCKKARKQESN